MWAKRAPASSHPTHAASPLIANSGHWSCCEGGRRAEVAPRAISIRYAVLGDQPLEETNKFGLSAPSLRRIQDEMTEPFTHGLSARDRPAVLSRDGLIAVVYFFCCAANFLGEGFPFST